VDIRPAVVLPAAATATPESIDAIRQWNAEGRMPAKNGFVRPIVDAVHVSLRANDTAKQSSAVSGRGHMTSTATAITWSGSFRVEKAAELRLHLEEITLPAGAMMWVYGNSGEAIAFDSSLVDDRGGLWTPSVYGDTAHLEVEIPANSTAGFVVRELLEIVANALTPSPSDISCLVDAACISTATNSKIDALKRATAQLAYVKGGSGYVCTGGLLNSRAGDFVPYLLTANHCISDQSSASSLQATWDYARASCNGAIPSRSSFPKSTGATLLATSASSDFTLLRLNSVPAGRWFLGWSASSLASGTSLCRVSHPVPDEYGIVLPQTYSTTYVDNTTAACSSRPRPNTLYSTYFQGATWGGSSGSPVVYVTQGDAYVVGQLTGTCSFTGSGDCDFRTRNMDGAFSVTYSSITPWLESSGPSPAVCTPSASTVCLSGDRFAVSATWQFPDGKSGPATGVRITSDTGYFWFIQSSNVELVVKVLNACSLNAGVWVFAGGLTNVGVVITVRDTKTGSVKTYTNPVNVAFQPVQDTSAFSSCP